NFGPGQYVAVGVNSSNDVALALGTNGGPRIVGDSSAGTQFITTAPSISGTSDPLDPSLPWYPGLRTQMQAFSPVDQATLTSTLRQGEISIKSGNSGYVSLTGINKTNLPTGTVSDLLANHNNSLVWQDRKNSFNEYNHAPSAAC